eukprot:TRINITY_DN1655_c0_g1_i1.p1 TRINITY_DN1655_c0_g1~~TRINITY_DN1655_c0_g1_i1.p1  ORF type:complete len:303 (+),score=42.60 TRINITY_DN1655_c0_g1_i1:155-1063(+)
MSKPGSAGIASDQHANIDKRERLRQLALETIDLAKDPYFMKNHLGSYECKLCLTLHNNEGNYLAHTQGKRHQTNLARRAARDLGRDQPAIQNTNKVRASVIKTIKVGRPGYKIIQEKDAETGQRSLLFELEYPEIAEGIQPRHRFMSAFEQKVEPVKDKRYQYLIFAAEPYETIAFKIPNKEIERDINSGKFYYNWDRERKSFTVRPLFFYFTPLFFQLIFLLSAQNPFQRRPTSSAIKNRIEPCFFLFDYYGELVVVSFSMSSTITGEATPSGSFFLVFNLGTSQSTYGFNLNPSKLGTSY